MTNIKKLSENIEKCLDEMQDKTMDLSIQIKDNVISESIRDIIQNLTELMIYLDFKQYEEGRKDE